MAVTILSNRANTSAVIHVSSANVELVIAGNNSVSNVAIGEEILTGCAITQIAWGCSGGNNHIQLYRGANLAGVYDSTGYIDYAGNGMSLTKDSAANVSVNFVNGANAYCIFEVQKIL